MTLEQLKALYELLASQQAEIIQLNQKLAEVRGIANERGTAIEQLRAQVAELQAPVSDVEESREA